MTSYQAVEGTWEKLSQVTVKGAEYDSRERQPHPKCLKGTRVDLLDYIYGLLQKKEKNRLIWLHGTAGVGKSAVAFTVAEKMRGLKMTEETKIEKRLGGTFFFSRKHTKRRTTGYFFATLAYQLAINFPSVRGDVNRAIIENPALLDPDKSLRDQMEALFLRPLRKLLLRLRECPPLVFVIDALDECTPESLESESLDEPTAESELADLISLLGEALCEPDLPIIHILLTSRPEEHIRKAMQTEEMRPLVCEIPVKTSGKGVAATISLDGADVDNDIYIFLQHSFRELGSRHSDFPQPSVDQLARLASRAGRRFIVASTMMKFIDDRNHDPRDRLELMLELTSKMLPGTEVYKLYDRILSTCADPTLAYLHLSVVAALTDPLPLSQISKLLGPGQGRDVETVLTQLRSIINVPTDISLPVNIYHSSVRDYVSHRSNCSLRQVRYIASPHSLLALSSFRLMMQDLPDRTALLDALSELKKHSQATQPQDPKNMKDSLSFIVQSPDPLQVLIGLLWVRGDRGPELQFWLETLDGHAWLQTQGGKDWMLTDGGRHWLLNQGGMDWLQTPGGLDWLQTPGGLDWLQTPGGLDWLQTPAIKVWLRTQGGFNWLRNEAGLDWMQTPAMKVWLRTKGGFNWLCTEAGLNWLQTQTRDGRVGLQTQRRRNQLHVLAMYVWMESSGDQVCMQEWLQTPSSQQWFPSLSSYRQSSLSFSVSYAPISQPFSQLSHNRGDQLQTSDEGAWLIPGSLHWLQTLDGREWMQYRGGWDWLSTQSGRNWLQDTGGQDWLQTSGGRDWLQIYGRDWLQTQGGQDWLQTYGQAWRLTTIWVTVEEFSSTSEAVREYIIAPELLLQQAFQAIQQFKSLPDFLMFPAFLALRHQEHSTSALPQGCPPDMEIIHAMKAFSTFAYEARARSRSASDALNYACQNWAIHLSRAPNPWDNRLAYLFKSFWNHNLLSWLERQWSLRDLHSCLIILSEGQKLAMEHLL
ncbi:hypothetical protein EV702DRAFT_521224 [Suillus placidus]|uniref:NACHT domain-containing protein n=1 Tax=Suillus placidus TaxID=48579 RepID=A0A9P6ZR09_9AGAM|nr:hypothetical protein EV702DRAFT_521224 [Suillus placidus]